MKHDDSIIDKVENIQPLFTTRDTCVGLAACMGIGLVTSIMLSVIILVLSASSSSQAEANSATANKESNAYIKARFSPEGVISQHCDTRHGQLRNIAIGDKMVYLNEVNQEQIFRVTGIQKVDSKPAVLPVVDESSMLSLVTCYLTNSSDANASISYLVMIQEVSIKEARTETRIETRAETRPSNI